VWRGAVPLMLLLPSSRVFQPTISLTPSSLPQSRNPATPPAIIPKLQAFEPSVLADTLHAYGQAAYYDYELMTVSFECCWWRCAHALRTWIEI